MRCDRPTDLGANYAFTAQHYQRLRQTDSHASQTNTDRHSDTILIYQNLIPPKHRADDKRRGGGRATTVIRARPPPPLLLRPPSVRPSRRWHHVLAVSQSSIISLRSFLSSSLFLSSSSFELGEKSHQQRDHRRVDHLLPLGAD